MNKQIELRRKAQALYERLAGDKLEQCNEVAERFMDRGYKVERAWAEALDVFKRVNNESLYE